VAAHPGQPRLINPPRNSAAGAIRLTRSNARKMLSPVASVHRWSSVSMTNCVRTVSQKIQ
jgi:NAD-dependent DNA ligase